MSVLVSCCTVCHGEADKNQDRVAVIQRIQVHIPLFISDHCLSVEAFWLGETTNKTLFMSLGLQSSLFSSGLNRCP